MQWSLDTFLFLICQKPSDLILYFHSLFIQQIILEFSFDHYPVENRMENSSIKSQQQKEATCVSVAALSKQTLRQNFKF